MHLHSVVRWLLPCVWVVSLQQISRKAVESTYQIIVPFMPPTSETDSSLLCICTWIGRSTIVPIFCTHLLHPSHFHTVAAFLDPMSGSLAPEYFRNVRTLRFFTFSRKCNVAENGVVSYKKNQGHGLASFSKVHDIHSSWWSHSECVCGFVLIITFGLLGLTLLLSMFW